jgi:putative oxidoreductase
MKKIFSTAINNKGVNTWLLLARLAVGGFMLTHGVPKFQNLLAGNMKFGDPLGIGATPSFILVVFSEFACSILLMLGLATRFASIVLIINMAVAAFVALGAQPFGKKELPLLYLVFFIGFCIMGGGKYAVDSLINRKSKSRY